MHGKSSLSRYGNDCSGRVFRLVDVWPVEKLLGLQPFEKSTKTCLLFFYRQTTPPPHPRGRPRKRSFPFVLISYLSSSNEKVIKPLLLAGLLAFLEGVSCVLKASTPEETWSLVTFLISRASWYASLAAMSIYVQRRFVLCCRFEADIVSQTARDGVSRLHMSFVYRWTSACKNTGHCRSYFVMGSDILIRIRRLVDNRI